MKLRRLVDRYITHRRSLGERCQTNASILRAFCRGLRCDIDLKQIDVRFRLPDWSVPKPVPTPRLLR